MERRYTESDGAINAVCFTGHREIDTASACQIPSVLKEVIRETISRGATRFLTGGAMGFDTIAALCVLELKEEFPNIRLELILPCREQAKNWNEVGRSVYNMILARADRIEYLHDTYTSSCMHDRNRRLVDLCDMVIAYCAHSGGGTAYTIAYALNQKREPVNIYDFING